MLRSGAVMVYDCFQDYGPGIILIIIINCEAPVSTFCGAGAILMFIIIY